MNVNVVRIPTMATILKNKNYIYLPAKPAWDQTLVGTGAITMAETYANVLTGVTASSSAMRKSDMSGLDYSQAVTGQIDWTKELWLLFFMRINTADAEAVARVQLKTANTIGAMADKGVGWQFDNLAVSGESYGASLATVDLATTMTASKNYYFWLHFTPTAIRWYINGVLKGSQTTAAKIPTTTSGISMVVSALNGGTGGASYGPTIGGIYIVQSR